MNRSKAFQPAARLRTVVVYHAIAMVSLLYERAIKA